MALAFMVPPKGKASAEVSPKPEKNKTKDNHASQTAPPHLTGSWDFSRLFTVEADPEVVGDAKESAVKARHIAQDAWRMTVKAAEKINAEKQAETALATSTAVEAAAATDPAAFTPKPMTHEEVRLWLQSFNAGPYACLKYEGNVPYQETRNYVPRVMKYYEEVKETEYDAEIEAAAKKYGLDPQMIRAIMKTESSFNNETVSHAGARGLMQVMPVVWKDVKEKYGFDWDYSTGVFEPEKNIEVACAYLAWLRYDFLPRHFDAYESDPEAPVVLVRDRDRGVPDRQSPRIVVKASDGSPSTVEVASARPVEKKTVSDQPARDSSPAAKPVVAARSATSDSKEDEKKSGNSRIEITDARDSNSAKSKSGNGKTKIVMRGGNGKIAISVGGDGKVAAASSKSTKAAPKIAARSDDSKDQNDLAHSKRKSVAKADQKEDTHGG